MSRATVGFGAASLLAVAAGAFACARSGVPAAAWGANLAAWGAGAVAAALVARWGARLLPVAPWIALLGLLATLLGPDPDGVHRWVRAGPVTVNVAMLVVPALVVALAARGERTWIAAFGCLGLLVAQPDASQATALGGAMALVAVRSRPALAGASVVLAGLAWLRPDPLAPVAHVEGILGLAAEISPLLAAVALAAVAAAAATPLLAARSVAGAALALCLALQVAAPFLGAFPVPLVGVGLAPVAGWWLGVGLLAAPSRAEDGRPR